ncbi:hypothetical protein BC940DRAFT_358011 [Gongronella butleri]|nr:hypothetical protein BC940DRAFT_358011 [Gongronella butleri]
MNERPLSVPPTENSLRSIHVLDDRLSHYTVARSTSIASDLLHAAPQELQRFFQERPSRPDEDVCFPSTSPTATPGSPACLTPNSSTCKRRSMNPSILEHLNTRDPEKDVSMDIQEKKLSLYGDNHLHLTPLVFIDRFVYYHPEVGRRQARTLRELATDSWSLDTLFAKENYWLDVTCPTQAEMKTISQIFGIHALTAEDIMSQEIREKCDSFRDYLFVSYRAFVHDDVQLTPINFYNIVFRRHLLTVHFDQVPHVDYVLQRVHQLQDFITLVPEWINYALMDEITDSFAPLIQQIEQEVENLEDYVLHTTTTSADDQNMTICRIGMCRKRVVQLLRLLSSKSDVIRALIKRFEERSSFIDDSGSTSTLVKMPSSPSSEQDNKKCLFPVYGRIIPDVALYLGDVQDHIVTMLQNLNHFETALARSHSNYLAKISIELTQTSNATNQVIGRLTIFATVLVPMNLVTGLFGMNVKVPGKDYDNLIYFFWIVCSLAVFGIISFTMARQMKMF